MKKSSSHRSNGPAPPGNDRRDDDFVSRDLALDLLGVKKQTLYTYTSRGWIHSRPVQDGRERVYFRADLEKLRSRSLARAGSTAIAEGALRYGGQPVITTAITELTDDGPKYRGRLALDLVAAKIPFETVALWLWTGVWLDGFTAWNEQPSFRPPPQYATSMPRDSKMIAHIMALAALDLGIQTGSEQSLRKSEALSHARAIIQVLTGMLATLSPERRYMPVRARRSIASAAVMALGREADETAASAINSALILCADYELTPPSFAARVVASSGGTLHAGVAAGLCAHAGLATGRICDRLENLLFGNTVSSASQIRTLRQKGVGLYGFNHILARKGDPRARWMLERAKQIAPPGSRVAQVLETLELLRDEHSLFPGLPVGLVTLASALALPPGTAMALWGLGRVAGHIAHILEQREAGYILRPRALFMDRTKASSPLKA